MEPSMKVKFKVLCIDDTDYAHVIKGKIYGVVDITNEQCYSIINDENTVSGFYEKKDFIRIKNEKAAKLLYGE